MTKYNIELFEVENNQQKYNNFLVFLIRRFYNRNFNGTFNRRDFIQIGVEKYGYNKKTIERIFDKGRKDNRYIQGEYMKRGKRYYVLKANAQKNENHILVKIDKKILNKIQKIDDFYTFCILIQAAKPLKYSEKIKPEDFYKVRGRTLQTIGKKIKKMPKNGVFYHIEKGEELFRDNFFVIKRKIPFYGKVIPISSLYFFDGIEYISSLGYNRIKGLYRTSLQKNLSDMNNTELQTLGLEVKSKNNKRKLLYTFGTDLDLGKQFLGNNGEIKYTELYNNYNSIIEKVIAQYNE